MKQVNFVLYANGAPGSEFSSEDETINCKDAQCGRNCTDVKQCIYPAQFQEYLASIFPEYNVKMDVRYQSYSDSTTDKDILRVDANLIKKQRPDFMNTFLDTNVRIKKK